MNRCSLRHSSRRRPFIERCLDEALGLSVGARCIGFGANVLDAAALAGLGEVPRLVARAIVGHYLPVQDCENQPLSTARRQSGFLVDVHPVVLEVTVVSQQQLPSFGPDGQPIESSQLAIVRDVIGIHEGRAGSVQDDGRLRAPDAFGLDSTKCLDADNVVRHVKIGISAEAYSNGLVSSSVSPPTETGSLSARFGMAGTHGPISHGFPAPIHASNTQTARAY